MLHRCCYFGIYVSFISPVFFPIILLWVWFSLFSFSLSYIYTLYYHVSKSCTKIHMHTYMPAWFVHIHYIILCLIHTYTPTLYHCVEFIHTYTLYYSVFDSYAYIHTHIYICTPYCLIHIHKLFIYVSFYFALSAYMHIHTHYTTVYLIHTHILTS